VIIQVTKTTSIEWVAPWEKSGPQANDVVGIELDVDRPEGCPAVRLKRHQGKLSLAAVGFLPPPPGELPDSWEKLTEPTGWVLPSLFRAKQAALTCCPPLSFTRQTAASPSTGGSAAVEGLPSSNDGLRTVFRKMADEASVLTAAMPDCQVYWMAHLIPSSRRPAVRSIQTSPCALLSSLTAQPGFCEKDDEAALFITQKAIYFAGFRKGIPLLFRECPGVAGVAGMRQTVKTELGLDDTMLNTVLSCDGIIDVRPVLLPLLSSVLSQVEISLDYLKSRMGANVRRMFLMGDATGCALFRHVLDGRFSLPLETPNPFDGLEPPMKATPWKNDYCMGDVSQTFLTALGAALSVMKEAK